MAAPKDPRPVTPGDGTKRSWDGRRQEHRLEVRRDFVDAAFRILDRNGPYLTMDDVAKEADTAKPKLYRHFDDKSDLFVAILERIQQLLLSRSLESVDLLRDSVTDVIRQVCAAFLSLAEEHPNVVLFVIHGNFTQSRDQSSRLVEVAQSGATIATQLIADQVGDIEYDTRSFELTIYTVLAAVGAAANWWLVSNDGSESPMPSDFYLEHLFALISAMVVSTAQLNQFDIALDQPLHTAFTATRR